MGGGISLILGPTEGKRFISVVEMALSIDRILLKSHLDKITYDVKETGFTKHCFDTDSPVIKHSQTPHSLYDSKGEEVKVLVSVDKEHLYIKRNHELSESLAIAWVMAYFNY